MELIFLIIILGFGLAVCFRWIIVAFVTIIGMANAGFLAGLGMGVVAYYLISLAKWISVIYLTSKTVQEVRKN